VIGETQSLLRFPGCGQVSKLVGLAHSGKVCERIARVDRHLHTCLHIANTSLGGRVLRGRVMGKSAVGDAPRQLNYTSVAS